MIEISDVLEVKNHIEGLKAVIFDLDDTLYSEKEYVRSGYQKIAEILPEVENAAEKLWMLFETKKPAIAAARASQRFPPKKTAKPPAAITPPTIERYLGKGLV